jgi:hypothetical protein
LKFWNSICIAVLYSLWLFRVLIQLPKEGKGSSKEGKGSSKEGKGSSKEGKGSPKLPKVGGG